MKDQQERKSRLKIVSFLIISIFLVGVIAYNLFSKKELFGQLFKRSSSENSVVLTKNQVNENSFEELLKEKNLLDESISTLRQKGWEIESLKMELNKKINQASEKIKLSMRSNPNKNTSNDNGMISCSYSKNSEEIERELQTIQYNKTYIGKLDEILNQINTAVVRSVFISNKFDTDIQVASVIGKDTIQKIREEVSNKIQENIPLSTNINLNPSDFENSVTLDEIWENLYADCFYENQKRGAILANLERHVKTKSDLEERIDTIKKLKEESKKKIELASQKIKNLRNDDRIITKVDSSGMIRYPNYARFHFEKIEWDKDILRDLQTILHQEAYLEELKAMEEKFESGIKKSNDASLNFNGYSASKLVELIYLDKKKEDYDKIIKVNQENWEILNTNNPLKIKVKPTVTPKEIWDRFSISLPVEGVRTESNSDLPPNRPGYILHKHNENDTFHEHPEECTRYSNGTSVCSSPNHNRH